MAVSREEARNIGKKSAEKVIKSVQGCRCGIAMWDASATSEFFEGIINAKQPALLQTLPKLMEDVLKIVEQDCGVDMSKPRELTKRLEADIKKEDWKEARVNFALLRGSIIGPLQECAAEEPPLYREVGGKKYKLVGTEKDLEKAETWATRMWEKSGEKITLIPYTGGYALYREE